MFDHYLKTGIALVMGHAAQGEQLEWNDDDILVCLALRDESLGQFLEVVVV